MAIEFGRATNNPSEERPPIIPRRERLTPRELLNSRINNILAGKKIILLEETRTILMDVELQTPSLDEKTSEELRRRTYFLEAVDPDTEENKKVAFESIRELIDQAQTKDRYGRFVLLKRARVQMTERDILRRMQKAPEKQTKIALYLMRELIGARRNVINVEIPGNSL